ncbi:hypothetical protein F53441_13492, partial [Fusarium austroafricanum]
MDPLLIATSVVGLTATCLSTCKKLHDLAGEYEEVPTIIAMICSESTVISMGLSELQSKILRRDDLAQAWASRTDILNVFETALTGFMTVFSCLEAETRNLKLKNPGVLAKLKFIWNQDRLKELLEALRGQQTSITFLLNILEMDTLSNIQKDIREHTRKIEATAAETQFLRSRNPSIKIESQSIFDKDASRLSFFGAETTSNFAPSELDFQFDDLVINSNTYRRAYAKAHTENQESHKQAEDKDVNSDSATSKAVNFKIMTISKDTPRGISQISLCDTIEAPAEEEGSSPESQTSSLEEAAEEENHQNVDMNGSDSQVFVFNQAVTQLVCKRCSVDITGSYHTYEKGVYCELHFCRKFAPYCGGCKFPLLEGYYLQPLDEAGVKKNWHPECLIMAEFWSVQIPVSLKGRKYLTTIQSGSMQDLMPDIRVQHVTCLQRIFQLGSHILSTFAQNFHLALVYRKAGSGGHESFRYWRIMLFAASRL